MQEALGHQYTLDRVAGPDHDFHAHLLSTNKAKTVSLQARPTSRKLGDSRYQEKYCGLSNIREPYSMR